MYQRCSDIVNRDQIGSRSSLKLCEMITKALVLPRVATFASSFVPSFTLSKICWLQQKTQISLGTDKHASFLVCPLLPLFAIAEEIICVTYLN